MRHSADDQKVCQMNEVILSVGIMAHPKRKPFVDDLLSQLGPAAVYWDTDNNRWHTGLKALRGEAGHAETTHSLILQDDAILCKDFVEGVLRVIQMVPEGIPVNLYTGVYRKFIHEMNTAYMQKPFNWLVTPGILWGVGIVLPTFDLLDIISYCEDRPEQNYDMRISRYYENVKQCGVWSPIPSLVDHRDGPSLVAGRRGGRRAWKFIGRNASALDFPHPVVKRELNLRREITD